MNEFFKWAYDSPYLACIIMICICSTIHGVLYKLPRFTIRAINIFFNGWPPEHLDADGDFKDK